MRDIKYRVALQEQHAPGISLGMRVTERDTFSLSGFS